MRYLILILSVLTLFSCDIDDRFYVIPEKIEYIPSDPINELTPEKVELGRKLFFDVSISEDGRTSCAHCHDPKKGFTSGTKEFPGGCGQGCILDIHGLRLDPNYQGAVDTMNFVKSYGAAGSAYMEILGRSGRFGLTGQNATDREYILKHFNLNEDFPACEATLMQARVALDGHRQFLKKRLKQNPILLKSIDKAFPGVELDSITVDSIKMMLACGLDAFQRVEGLRYIHGTKFQRVAMGQLQFKLKEKRGYELFKTNCTSCHDNKVMGGGLNPSHMASNRFGVDSRTELTGIEYDKPLRVTPPLRNNLFSHPCWGYDCSYDSVEEYMEDKYESMGLFYVSDQDKSDMIAFLKTL